MPRNPVVQSALEIAARDLRWCYRERGIMTGSRLVYWSWDSFFASLGADCLGDTGTVKHNLELYLGLQAENGSLPKNIAHPLYFLKFVGLPIKEDSHKQRPNFSNAYFTAPSLTQNPTFVIALHDYVTVSGDLAFFKKHAGAVEVIMRYLASKESEFGLLKEGIGGGWAESVLKRGAIAFTNTCYARSAWCLSELYGMSGDTERSQHYLHVFAVLKDAINDVLWSDEDGGYYSDWYGHRRHHHFATDGNLLAIVWDIASKKQASCIEKRIAELSLEDDVPIRLAYSRYSFWRVYIFNRLGGLKDYHVGFCWSWLGCVDVLARLKMGKRKEAETILAKIAAVIVRDGTVHEIYDKGRPVRNPFYKSEQPWAWGAGLFVKACYALDYELTNHHA